MKTFLQRHQEQILGVLNGFDRMRFRGTLRVLANVAGVRGYLSRVRVLLKEFIGHCEQMTGRLRRELEARAVAWGRPVQYLAGVTNKEDLVAKIRAEQGSTREGLIAVLSTIESCMSYEIGRDRQTRHLELRRRQRKCLHYYVYFEDSMFGLAHVRLQTWFPFGMHVLLNGREWLARQLDAAKVGYVRRDNCFTAIEDFAWAQKLADRQPGVNWRKHLERLVQRVCPRPAELLGDDMSYYWTIEQSEWATDLVFRSPQALSDLYPVLMRRGIETFGSRDVMRFLGRKVPAQGGLHGNFAGEVVSDLKQRPEGMRLKHRAGQNTVKMYNKQAEVLRVETTFNDVQGLKVFRRKDQDPQQPRQWLPLRKSVADMRRRAELSQSANQRYLEAFSTIDSDTPLSRLAEKLCCPVWQGERRYRALNPLSPDDARLLEVISRGQYQITGFRNRDVREAWYGATEDPLSRRRQSGAITRKLAMLRAHGLIKKIPHTHRYLITKEGAKPIAALLAARSATVQQLTPAA